MPYTPINLKRPFNLREGDEIRYLSNFRPSIQPGVLEHCPRFSTLHEPDNNNVYLTDSSTTVGAQANSYYTPIHLFNHSGLMDTDEFLAVYSHSAYLINYDSGSREYYVPIYRKTTQPSNGDDTDGCRLVLHDSEIVGTVGNTVEVDIASSTTFRWRKNGGSWSSAATIDVAGNSIDSGNATVYWLTSTGFTTSDTWVWTRTDTVSANASDARDKPTEHRIYNDTVFFTAANKLFNVEDAGGAQGLYIIQSGYYNYDADYLEVFEGSLFTFIEQSTGSLLVRNSDVQDIYNFISTVDNEADFYTLDTSTPQTYKSNRPFVGTLVQNQLMYVVLSNQTYVTGYAGLPAPFSFKPVVSYDYFVPRNTYCVVSTGDSLYIADPKNTYRFSNGQFEILNLSPHTMTQLVERTNYTDSAFFHDKGIYDVSRNTVMFPVRLGNAGSQEGSFFCLDRRTGQTYYRYAPFELPGDNRNALFAMFYDEVGTSYEKRSQGVILCGLEEDVLVEDVYYTRGEHVEGGSNDTTGPVASVIQLELGSADVFQTKEIIDIHVGTEVSSMGGIDYSNYTDYYDVKGYWASNDSGFWDGGNDSTTTQTFEKFTAGASNNSKVQKIPFRKSYRSALVDIIFTGGNTSDVIWPFYVTHISLGRKETRSTTR